MAEFKDVENKLENGIYISKEKTSDGIFHRKNTSGMLDLN